MKYTPGPWLASHHTLQDGFGGKKWVKILDKHRTTICEFSEWTEEAKANAILIAAAPELLESAKEGYGALKDIINAAGNGEPYDRDELENLFGSILNTLYAVISKAEGKEG